MWTKNVFSSSDCVSCAFSDYVGSLERIYRIIIFGFRVPIPIRTKLDGSIWTSNSEAQLFVWNTVWASTCQSCSTWYIYNIYLRYLFLSDSRAKTSYWGNGSLLWKVICQLKPGSNWRRLLLMLVLKWWRKALIQRDAPGCPKLSDMFFYLIRRHAHGTYKHTDFPHLPGLASPRCGGSALRASAAYPAPFGNWVAEHFAGDATWWRYW